MYHRPNETALSLVHSETVIWLTVFTIQKLPRHCCVFQSVCETPVWVLVMDTARPNVAMFTISVATTRATVRPATVTSSVRTVSDCSIVIVVVIVVVIIVIVIIIIVVDYIVNYHGWFHENGNGNGYLW